MVAHLDESYLICLVCRLLVTRTSYASHFTWVFFGFIPSWGIYGFLAEYFYHHHGYSSSLIKNVTLLSLDSLGSCHYHYLTHIFALQSSKTIFAISSSRACSLCLCTFTISMSLYLRSSCLNSNTLLLHLLLYFSFQLETLYLDCTLQTYLKVDPTHQSTSFVI